jgi:hypothetical protein
MRKLKFKLFLVPLFLVFIAVFLYFYYFSYKYTPNKQLITEIENKLKSFHPYAINECIIILKNLDLTYSICTFNNGKIVLRNEYLNCTYENNNCLIGNLNKTFSPGEYFSAVVNLQKLKIPFENYYVCAFSNIPIYETNYPKRNDTIGIHLSSFDCSQKFHKKDFHAVSLSGYALDKKGEYKILEIYVFDGNLPENFDFKNNLKKGIKIYELEGEIA